MMKNKIKQIKVVFSSIPIQDFNSFAIPFIFSFIVFLLVTAINLKIDKTFSNISIALPTYCSSLFSTTITFCITTTIQNFFKNKYSNQESNSRSSKFNIISVGYSFAYLLVYMLYWLDKNVTFGKWFIVLSFVAIFLSLLAFVETYSKVPNSISGKE